MPGMALAAEVDDLGLLEGEAREDGHAVIGLLAVDRLMDVAQLFQLVAGKQVVFDLDFLQRQHVGLMLLEELARPGRSAAGPS